MAELLAKPDVSLIDHLQQVVSLGDKVASRLKLDKKTRVKALLACAMHDIGKATESFQEYMGTVRMFEIAKKSGADLGEIKRLKREVEKKKSKAYPHALASFPIVLVIELSLNRFNELNLTASAAVLTHHSPLSAHLYEDYDTSPGYHPELENLLKAIIEFLQTFGVEIDTNVLKSLFDKNCLLENPASLLNWSFESKDGNKTLRGVLKDLQPSEFAQVKSVLHLSDWLASIKKFDHGVLFLDNGRSNVEKHVRKFNLHSFQKELSNTRAEVVYLCAPTGTGKTEALLLWAGDTERLIYLLPTQATVNAMWKRLYSIYGKNLVGLAHGRANYILRKDSDEEPLEEHLFGSVFAKPVTVATLDQFLLAYLNGRHWEERRSLSKRATVIIDEIHTYEPYTLGLLAEALSFEKPKRIAFASATLPNSLFSFFPDGKLIKAEEQLWKRKRHRLELRVGKIQESVYESLKLAQEGKSVLIVVNTIRDAQNLYGVIKEIYNDVALLHSRFIFRDRQEKEMHVKEAKPGIIFVSTQVVEVSLDINYDVLITEIAPIDALVQRMGRVNRKGDKEPVPVIVYCNWSDGSRRIYGEDVLKWSLELLKDLPNLPTDLDLVEVTDKLYDKVTSSEDWRKEFEEGRNTLKEIQKTLGCYTIDLSDDELRSRFTARRGQVSIEVLPSKFIEEAYELKDNNEAWRLTELFVPIPIYWLVKKELFNKNSDLHCIVTDLDYNPEIGLSMPDEDAKSGFMLLE